MRNRLAVALCVLSLYFVVFFLRGTSASPISFVFLVWRQDHQHVPTFHIWALLYDTNFIQGFFYSCQAVSTDMLMCDLSTAEPYPKLDLLTFLQPSCCAFDVELQVVFVGLWPQLNLFDRDLHLVLFRLPFLTALFVLKLAVVHDTANRRLGIWRYLDQVKPNIVCALLGVPKTDYTNICVGIVNKSNLAYAANISIDSMR